MKNSMTWLVLSNNAPSFEEMKAMYLRLGGKDNVAGLTKCHLAHMIDYLTIIKENKADILKLADDILGTDTAEREYSDDGLHCEYKVGKIKAVVDMDGCQYNSIVYEGTEYPRYLYEDVSGSFEGAMEWLKEIREQLREEIEWTQLDQTINSSDNWEEVIDQREGKYKGYTFRLWIRTYNEDATEDEPPYSEGEDRCWCVETDETIGEDEGHYDEHIRDYVNNLNN